MESTLDTSSGQFELSAALPVLLMGLLGLVAMAFSIRVAWRRREAGLPGSWLPLVVLPVLFLLLFTSLGLHMHQSLGGWPASIGTHGFPQALITHGEVAFFVFSVLFLGVLAGLPLGLVLYGGVPRLRPALGTFGLYMACHVGVLLLMNLAPSEFLHWWWD